MRSQDIAGLVIGRLTVIAPTTQKDAWGSTIWRCRCECGATVNVSRGSLTKAHHGRGGTRSCGCLNTEIITKHGAAKRGERWNREYRIWTGIRGRCLNNRDQAYRLYGGRGITVCERWSDFRTFFADMGPCPPGHTIDRIDNDKGYEPANCRWATTAEQGVNKRTNRRFTIDGVTLCVSEWARKVGFTPDLVLMRLHRGWSIEHALTKPIRRRRRPH